MDFKNIPKKYRPIPFWSWNDKLEKEELVSQVKWMKENGDELIAYTVECPKMVGLDRGGFVKR